jgi:hypothetical protein
MLRLLLVFSAGAAFGWGALAAAWLDWTAVVGLWAGSVLFLVAFVGVTAPEPQVVARGQGLRLVSDLREKVAP